MILEIGIAAGAFILGNVFQIIQLRKNKGLYSFINSVRKKKMLAFLETDTGVHFKPIEKIYKNLGVTNDKEILVMPEGSMKPCLTFGGIPIVHGDLYKSICSTKDLRLFVEKMKTDFRLTDNEVADFLFNLQRFSDLERVEYLKKLAKGEVVDEILQEIKLKDDKGEDVLDEAGNAKTTLVPAFAIRQPKQKDQQELSLYMSLPSQVKNYILTGINRVQILAMLRELVYQRELENMGKKDWIIIAIAVLIISVAVWLVLPKILPFFMGSVPASTSSISPPSVISMP